MKKLYLLSLLPLLTGCLEYSDGDRVGTVIKFSKKGFFCKTWEGEMYLGGLKKNSDSDGNISMVANTWEFTVEDPALVPQIQKALDDGKHIQLTYRQEIFTFCRADSHNYFITGIK